MSEWIIVDDELPEIGKWCLAFGGNQIEILFMDSHEPVIWLRHGYWPGRVTHWMPLPESPKKD